MATEIVYADAVVTAGAANSQNALGAPDGVYTTDAGNINWTARWSLGNPTDPDLAQIEQSVTTRVRKDSTNSGNPTFNINIYVGGTQAYSSPTITVTSNAGADVQFLWTPPSAAMDASAVDVEVISTSAGGSPSVRNSLQIDAITAVIETAAAAANQPPVANAGSDQSVEVNTEVTLDGSGSSDPDGTITGYSWTLLSGPTMLPNGSSSTYVFTPTQTGTYTFRLTVTDNDGATATDDVTVTVTEAANQAPVANAGPDQNVDTNSTVTLDGSGSSDPDGSVASYSWAQVSGPTILWATSTTIVNPQFTPATDGTYVVELTVTDNEGATATDTVSVTATTPGSGPVVSGSSVFFDDFTGTDGSTWDAAKWSMTTANGGSHVIESNEGAAKVVGNTGTTEAVRSVTTMDAVSDGEILCSYRYDVYGASGLLYARYWLRADGTWSNNIIPNNGIGIEIRSNSSSVFPFEVVGGTATALTSVSGLSPIEANTKRWLRMRVEGTTLSVKIWNDGTAEPSTWSAEWTISGALTSGIAQTNVRSSSSNTVETNAWRYDDFAVGDLNPGVVTPTVTSRMIGAVTPTGATVMTKTADATSVRLKVSTTADLLTSPVFTDPLTPDANGISKHIVTGLSANTHYYYGVEMDTETLVESGGQFSTFPNEGQTSFRFAFASCNYGDPDTWGRIRAHNPLMFFHLGDFFYDDGGDKTADGYRASYDTKLEAANSGYDGMHHLPVAYTWSDHDFGKEDAAHGGNTAQAVIDVAHAVYEQYVPYWNKPVPGAIAQTFVIGRVRFIITDTRTHRTLKSATDDATKTVLGADQKQWFKDTITNATEPLIFWVQDSVWVSDNTNNTDYWGSYSTERTELAQFINNSGKNLVILGGDMHALAVDDGTNSAGGITVLQSAAITGGGTHKGGPYSHGPYPEVLPESVRNYTIMDITDSGDTITFEYHGYDKNEVEVLTYSETLDATTGTTFTAYRKSGGEWVPILGAKRAPFSP